MFAILCLHMPGALPRCPVTGCSVWKHSLKKGGSSRRWYSVDSNRHLLVNQLDEALAALPCNDHICPNCYKRIRRLPPPAHNLLDELAAAADEQPLTPPSSPPTSQTLYAAFHGTANGWQYSRWQKRQSRGSGSEVVVEWCSTKSVVHTSQLGCVLRSQYTEKGGVN